MTRQQIIQKAIDNNFTIKSNINADFIKSMKKWAKEKGKEIAQCIKSNDTKEALKLIRMAISFKKAYKQYSIEHDKIITTPTREFWLDTKDNLYQLI